MLQLHAIVRGKVQGVFFRATVKNIAEKLHICGYVKNLKDGSVEIIAVGEKNELEHFINMVRENPGKAKVSTINCNYTSIKYSFSSFVIQYE